MTLFPDRPRIISNVNTIEAVNIAKKYGSRVLFRDITISLKTGESLCITGSNGSGKSTLLQVLACLRTPTRGSVTHARDGIIVDRESVHRGIGFMAPSLRPYEDLTGFELLRFALRGGGDERKIGSLLGDFDLSPYGGMRIRHYSSGMQQRLKCVIAIINDPPVLLLDEPGTNLDEKGKTLVYGTINDLKQDRIVIIATNEKREAELCDREVNLGA